MKFRHNIFENFKILKFEIFMNIDNSNNDTDNDTDIMLWLFIEASRVLRTQLRRKWGEALQVLKSTGFKSVDVYLCAGVREEAEIIKKVEIFKLVRNSRIF